MVMYSDGLRPHEPLAPVVMSSPTSVVAEGSAEAPSGVVPMNRKTWNPETVVTPSGQVIQFGTTCLTYQVPPV